MPRHSVSLRTGRATYTDMKRLGTNMISAMNYDSPNMRLPKLQHRLEDGPRCPGIVPRPYINAAHELRWQVRPTGAASYDVAEATAPVPTENPIRRGNHSDSVRARLASVHARNLHASVIDNRH